MTGCEAGCATDNNSFTLDEIASVEGLALKLSPAGSLKAQL